MPPIYELSRAIEVVPVAIDTASPVARYWSVVRVEAITDGERLTHESAPLPFVCKTCVLEPSADGAV